MYHDVFFDMQGCKRPGGWLEEGGIGFGVYTKFEFSILCNRSFIQFGFCC